MTADATWAALLHRPALGIDNAFDDPRFPQHVAFLRRLQDAGVLVGAGPFGDRRGEGMTVVRLPGADRMDEIVRLATEDDASVTGGLFTVEVRPWRVMFARS